MIASAHRYCLYKGSKKWKCAGCGQKTAVVYIDNETRELMPEHVSRCDRENSCGYHFTPKQYFSENDIKDFKPFVEQKATVPIKVDFLPNEYMARTVDYKFYSHNNLYRFLVSLFGENVTLDLCKQYLIGTSKYWKGATIYWQIDESGNVRQCKIILYNPYTGKRIKSGAEIEKFDKATKTFIKQVAEKSCSLVNGKYLDEYTQTLNLEQTFFGAHLLAEFPDNEVCIVESEKTALIASVYMPQFVWLATGGASGCKWRDYSVYKLLNGRSVTFFPDYGYFNKKTVKTCFAEWGDRVERIKEALQWNKIKVSDILEKRLAHLEREDQDLADLLIIRDKQTGIALTQGGYPVIWDYKKS